jgi:putative ABC transport system permease protein
MSKSNQEYKPPWVAEQILKLILPDRGWDTPLGDFEEVYGEKARRQGIVRAKFWYWTQVLALIPPKILNVLYWRVAMFTNYLKIAFRHMFRHKTFSSINIMGLSVGIACCLLVFMYVSHELSYDRYHRDVDRVFRIVQKIQKEAAELETARVATPLIPAIRENFPEVDHAVHFQLATWDSLVEREEKKFYEEWVMIAENDLFNVLTIPFIRGNPEQALARPGTVVITERLAKKYFGNEDPINKTLILWGNPVEVTGVIQNCPDNTHLRYDIIISLNGFEEDWDLDNWEWTGFYAYVRLKPHVDSELFEQKIRHVADLFISAELKEWGESFTFFLQPITSIHLNSRLNMEIASPGNPRDIYIFSILGFLILLISCINFTNLSTALSTHRAKEVGIRKVVGAHRVQLARQFLWESVLASVISMVISLIVVAVVLPHFNRLTGQDFSFPSLLKPSILLTLIGISLLAGAIAGSYPAFLLSRFLPARILKDATGLTAGGNVIRKILVVAQFSITIVLIIGTLVVYKQIRFMKNMDLGFDKEQKLIIPGNIRDRYESVKAEFMKNPSITGAAACWNVPGRLANLIEARLVGEKEEKAQSMNFYYVDHDFIPEYDIEIVAGRSFQKEIRSDIYDSFILNETAVRAFGFSSPEEVLGKKMYEGGSGGVGTIIGVTKDFFYKGLQTKVEPLVMQVRPDFFSTISLEVRTDNLKETISFVENKWNELQLGRLFSYFFLDEDFNRHYRSEENLGRLYATLTLLALFISCLGLAGLSAFSAQQRTKEIGVRKVLGAPVSGILFLLLSELLKWIFIANILAWPVAYFFMLQWLHSFAYRTKIGLWVFVFSAALAFLISVITVSYQSLRAALANPSNSLRYE